MDEGSKKGGNPHIDPNIILDPMKVDLVPIRTSYSHQIEPDDIQSADDIEDLLSEMHDFAEHEFRYYWLKESEFNSFISAAEQRGAIVSSEWEFCHSRHPSFPGPNYIRIIERENGYASDWHREVAEKGPMSVGITSDTAQFAVASIRRWLDAMYCGPVLRHPAELIQRPMICRL
jgi:hypothetical protein